MTLLDESVKKLGKNVEIIEDRDKKVIMKKFRKKAPLRKGGRIDWEAIGRGASLDGEHEIKHVCKRGDYYVIWDNPQLPILKTSLKNITRKDNIYSLIDVSFDTWILSEDFSDIVEIDRDGNITYKRFGEKYDYEDVEDEYTEDLEGEYIENVEEIEEQADEDGEYVEDDISTGGTIFGLLKYLYILLIIIIIVVIYIQVTP